MCTIIGDVARVVDADGFKIDELAGNVATKNDRISIACVQAAAGTKEPWLTLHYDEWICVRTGKVILSQESLPDLEVPAGKTVHIAPGTRFCPSFPVDTEYIPVCLPAFRPDRCVREDVTTEGEEVAAKLRKLHDGSAAPGESSASEAAATTSKEAAPEVLYHMTTVVEWQAATKEGVYYPKTYEADGHYTHATGVPSRLLTTANHFYKDVPGDWVCVQFTRTALRKAGIFVKDEEAMPVGDKAVSETWSKWVCPHVIGGIPTAVVDKEFPMTRVGEEYTAIEGLC